jgi:anti-sigma factor RsiW
MRPCEQEAKIDAYLLGKLSQAESEAFEEHYFNCPTCFQKTFARNELVDVIKYKGARIFAPEEEARAARRPVVETPKVSLWERITDFLTPRPWVAVAAAAAILLVVVVGIIPRSNPSAPIFTAIEDATVRGAAVEVVAPAGTLAQAPTELAWKAFSGAAEYGVSVFRGAEIVWSATTKDVRQALPKSLVRDLAAGAAFTWQVKAYAADGTMLGASARAEFRVAR